MPRKPIKRGGENTKPVGQRPTPPPAPPSPGCFSPIVTPAPPPVPQVNMASSDLVAWYSLQLQEEKRRREYYQNIVYEVCNILDDSRSSYDGKKTISGTVDNPSNDIVKTLNDILGNYASMIPL